MPRKPQPLILSKHAERDFAHIAAWTAEQFGERQARKYAGSIADLFTKIEADPTAWPSRSRDDLGPAYRTWHVGDKGRHLIVHRIEARRILVIRIPHDSMDLTQHLPKRG